MKLKTKIDFYPCWELGNHLSAALMILSPLIWWCIYADTTSMIRSPNDVPPPSPPLPCIACPQAMFRDPGCNSNYPSRLSERLQLLGIMEGIERNGSIKFCYVSKWFWKHLSFFVSFSSLKSICNYFLTNVKRYPGIRTEIRKNRLHKAHPLGCKAQPRGWALFNRS